jgi:hypothetical protein
VFPIGQSGDVAALGVAQREGFCIAVEVYQVEKVCVVVALRLAGAARGEVGGVGWSVGAGFQGGADRQQQRDGPHGSPFWWGGCPLPGH